MTKNTAERGYGSRHQRLRKRWAPIVNRGEATCSRCHQPIQPGAPWDLGHDDHDRTKYTGPEHRRCNRGEPQRQRMATPPSKGMVRVGGPKSPRVATAETGKIDEIAVVSKMGTEHENHIGWRFPEGKSANLYCSCGGLLVGKE